jgi:tetratricopeptide (TPR) repeat protein
MTKLKLHVFFFAALLFGNAVTAQTIEEGKKFFYYERYTSAKNVFQKLIAANPSNLDAVYWLGQSLIASDDNRDVAGAKELYRKALEANSSNALLTAAMGHVELLEGKTQDARNRFDAALGLSQNKSVAVLNAIGFANANLDAKNGDAAYAIEKLKMATATKGMKDPDVFVNLGDAYRKFGDGGAAQTAYEAALALSPTYARAKYRIGKIYETQGTTQEEIYLKYYNDAIALDPAYTHVYYNLYIYYYKTDVNKSASYLEKWLSVKDDEPVNCYYRTTIKYAQGLFKEAIAQADGCITSGGANPDVRLTAIKGYAQNRLGDSVSAKASFETYFQKQLPEKIQSGDLSTYADILLKFPGNEALAGTYIDKAVAIDTTEIGKVNLLKSVATKYEAQKNYAEAAAWYNKILAIKKAPSKTDIFNSGYSYYKGGNPAASVQSFILYTQKYPEDVLGYYWQGKASWVIDSTMAKGLANPSFEKAIQLGETAVDKTKIKSQLMGSYKYMIAYAVNMKKDKAAAIAFCDKALLIDSADAEIINNKSAISKMNLSASPSKPKQEVKPATKPATPKTTVVPKPVNDKAVPIKKK